MMGVPVWRRDAHLPAHTSESTDMRVRGSKAAAPTTPSTCYSSPSRSDPASGCRDWFSAPGFDCWGQGTRSIAET
eukprot:1127415-Rhodomonas_salina.1